LSAFSTPSSLDFSAKELAVLVLANGVEGSGGWPVQEPGMSARIVIADETSAGNVLHELELVWLLPVVTAAELIELRVRDEVGRFNASSGAEVFRGLIQPSEAEATLDGYEYRVRPRGPVDADEQCRKARLAFEANGFLLLVGDRQVESLNEPIRVTPDLRVSFVKLMPLVGG
jgi:hypothetical protein